MHYHTVLTSLLLFETEYVHAVGVQTSTFTTLSLNPRPLHLHMLSGSLLSKPSDQVIRVFEISSNSPHVFVKKEYYEKELSRMSNFIDLNNTIYT